MEKTYFITITGISHYYGSKPFEIGRVIRLIKKPDNEYDEEAIIAFLPFIDKIGYVANSTNTVYDGTISAGRLYDKIEEYAYARVMFVTHSSVIAVVLDKDDVEEDNDNDDDNETEEQTTPDLVIPKEQKSKKSINTKNPLGFRG